MPALIGLGVVAMAATVIVNMLITTRRSAETASWNAEFQLLVGQLKSILEQEKSCRTAIGGPRGVSEIPAGTYNPVNGTGTPVGGRSQNFVTTSPYPNIKLYRDFGTTVFMDPADSTKNRFGRLTVTGLRFIPGGAAITADGLTFRAYLLVTAQKPSSAIGGATLENWNGTNTTNLPVNLRVNAAGAILSCNGLSFLDGQVGLPTCLSDEALTGQAGSFRCVKVICPPTLVQSRPSAFPYKATGSINCVYAGP